MSIFPGKASVGLSLLLFFVDGVAEIRLSPSPLPSLLPQMGSFCDKAMAPKLTEWRRRSVVYSSFTAIFPEWGRWKRIFAGERMTTFLDEEEALGKKGIFGRKRHVTSPWQQKRHKTIKSHPPIGISLH